MTSPTALLPFTCHGSRCWTSVCQAALDCQPIGLRQCINCGCLRFPALPWLGLFQHLLCPCSRFYSYLRSMQMICLAPNLRCILAPCPLSLTACKAPTPSLWSAETAWWRARCLPPRSGLSQAQSTFLSSHTLCLIGWPSVLNHGAEQLWLQTTAWHEAALQVAAIDSSPTCQFHAG